MPNIIDIYFVYEQSLLTVECFEDDCGYSLFIVTSGYTFGRTATTKRL